MPTYVSFIDWTEQGIRKVKDSPKRLDSARKTLKKLGGDLKGFYMLQGGHDGVMIFEMPDDQALAKFLLINGSAGNVRTITHRAYTEEEYRKIMADLP
jgi:uncharacterized protein with GYD domain